MAFLNYGFVYYNDIKKLTKTEIIILSYVNSNKRDTTLTLKEWSQIVNTSERNITRAINKLTKLKKIINKSSKNKLILRNINNNILTKNEEKILMEFYDKLKK